MTDDYSLGTYTKLAETAEKKQQPAPATPVAQPRTQNVNEQKQQASKKPSNRDSTIARNHDSNIDSEEDVIELIRKAVKPTGKEASIHRLTADEKDAIADLVYAQRKKGITTSENEIARIALNYLIWEYRLNKQASILARVLERLNA
jgi:hypothetical protein